MKRRRNLLVVLLLVCAMGIGVGYAAITTNLTLNGTNTMEHQNINVLITGFEQTGVTAGSAAKIQATSELNKTTVSFGATGLVNQGDFVKATVTVTNYNDTDVALSNLKISCTDDGKDYYAVSSTFVDTTLKAAGETGDSVTFDVTLTVTEVWVSASDLVSDCSVTITADLVDTAP